MAAPRDDQSEKVDIAVLGAKIDALTETVTYMSSSIGPLLSRCGQCQDFMSRADKQLWHADSGDSRIADCEGSIKGLKIQVKILNSKFWTVVAATIAFAFGGWYWTWQQLATHMIQQSSSIVDIIKGKPGP